MTDQNITPDSPLPDDPMADLAAEVAEDYSEDEYAGGTEFGEDSFAAVVTSGPAQAVGRRKEAVVRARDVRGSHRALFVETHPLARIGRRADLVRAVGERRDVEPVRLGEVATERLRHVATAVRVMHEP